MKAKHLIMLLLAATMALPALYAAEEEPVRPPVEKKELRRRPPRKEPRRALNRPSKELRDAIKTYRENSSDENKAKVKALIEKEYDATIAREEKKIAEMKSKKEENINRRLERILKGPEKPPRPEKPGKPLPHE